MKYVRTTCPRPLFIGQNTGNRVFPGPEPRTYVPENVIRISPAPVTYVAEEFRRLKMCLVQCVCVFSSPFILDIRFVGRTSGPGREENRGTAGHQGRERQSAAR